MNQSNQMGRPGVDEPVADLIRQYFPDYPESSLRQTLSDPEVALLASLVRQGQGVEPADYELEETDVTAEYFAEEYTVTSAGPRSGGEEPDEVDGTEIDLGLTAQSFDLRFTDDIMVAFMGPNHPHRAIKYRAKDSPVVGKRATTSAVWVWRADSASSDATLFLEADRDGE